MGVLIVVPYDRDILRRDERFPLRGAMIRFEVNWAKAIEAIDFVAQLRPGITQYYIGKILFFADREHLLDYGRPITGDKYVAMEHGPVPSAVRDVLKADPLSPDELIDRLHSRVTIGRHGTNLLHVRSRGSQEFLALSGSDKEYLRDATQRYAHLSFERLKQISHEDVAYSDAWAKPGNNNELDIGHWFSQLDDPEIARAQIEEFARVGA
jgi:uncharacterized phage-associated protein